MSDSAATAAAAPPAPAATKPPTNRLPSLNQLAARINSSANISSNGTPSSTSSTTTTTSSGTPAAPRPRLAASILRTTSNASLASNATTASSADSTAVNPSATRAASPNTMASVSPPRSQSSTPSNDQGGEPLTSDKLEKLNAETTPPAPGAPPVAFPAVGGKPAVAAIAMGEKKPSMVKGYKNIPSLDAITQRLANKTRALSIDGTAKPPEPEMIEDPKTPGVPMKAPEHPLQYPWTIFHDTKSKFPYTPASATPHQIPPPLGSTPSSSNTTPTNATTNTSSSSIPDPPTSASVGFAPTESTDYEANLTTIGTFTTVEQFCRYMNWLKPPSKLERNSNYHLFKSGIKPMWEDPANAEGGKWVLTMRHSDGRSGQGGGAQGQGGAGGGMGMVGGDNGELLDRCWGYLCMALVGEELEEGGDEITGAVVSLRAKVDRIQVWTRRKDDVERLNRIGKKLVGLLDVGEKDGIGLEFVGNTPGGEAGERGAPSKFLSIQALPATSYRSSFQNLPNPNSNPNPNTPGVSGGPNNVGTPGGHGHAHSRSIGGIGLAGSGGFTPVEQHAQAPLSAGAGPAQGFGGTAAGQGAGAGGAGGGSAFGSFGVPLGGVGGGAWRRRG